MLRYDQHPSRQRDAIAQRQAMLDTIVDYRFFAPARFATDELWQREMARSELSRETSRHVAAPWAWTALRRRLGGTLIEVGTRLQGNPVAGLDPQPES